MSKIINVATIGGMVMERGEESPEEPLRQFREAAQKLDGTGVDLVITCETMMMNNPVGSGENRKIRDRFLTDTWNSPDATVARWREQRAFSSKEEAGSPFCITDRTVLCSECIIKCSPRMSQSARGHFPAAVLSQLIHRQGVLAESCAST